VTTATVVVEPVVTTPRPASLANLGVTKIVAILVVPAANLRVLAEASAEPDDAVAPAAMTDTDVASGAAAALTTIVHVTAAACAAVAERVCVAAVDDAKL
jgi:hypothetical protein